MTKLLEIFTIAVAMAIHSCWEPPSAPSPEDLHPEVWRNVASGNDLKAVYFVDTSLGYAVGEFGAILKTRDGGASWATQSSGTREPLKAVFFLNRDTGYAAGGEDHALLLKTMDGGASWKKQPGLEDKDGLSAVHFFNPDTGILAGGRFRMSLGKNYSAHVLATTDGGVHWSVVARFPDRESPEELDYLHFYLNSMSFPDARTAYLAGDGGILRKSTDGGKSWQALHSGTTDGLLSIHFPDRDTGYAVSWRGSFLKTVDGGKTWSIREHLADYLYAVHFTDTRTGTALGDDDRPALLLHTTDGGETWTRRHEEMEELSALHFVNARVGYAVGRRSGVLKTTDGGETWQVLRKSTSTMLHSIRFADARTGWAVGDEGMILGTGDGGETWLPQRVPKLTGTIPVTTDGWKTYSLRTVPKPLPVLNSVYPVNARIAYAVGGAGEDVIVLKTTNGGAAWSALPFPSDTVIAASSAYFVNADTGYVTALHNGKPGEDYQSAVFKTTDGGRTWSMRPLGDKFSKLNAIRFVNARCGYAAGTHRDPGIGEADMYKTTDGGESWVPKRNFPKGFGEIRSLQFLDENLGFAAGSTGFAKTTDGGEHWEQRRFDYGLNAVRFLNRDTGYAVGGNHGMGTTGDLLKTTDGGKTWLEESSRTGECLNDVFFTNSSGYIVGAGGTILKLQPPR